MKKMAKQTSKIIFFILFFTIVGCSSNYKYYLKQADQVHESGDRDTARKLYLEAAKRGSPEAHFAIAYRYPVTREESIYHFSEAAKQGHEKALYYVLDDLFFSADSLKRADPDKALRIYEQAKKANPNLQLFLEDIKIKTIQMSIEAGPFDWEDFCAKHNLEPHCDNCAYHVWHIAEEASRGRFGEPDPKLVFQLVSRGGWAPAELMAAIEDVYKNWKNGIVEEFNICNYITSGSGMAFCFARADRHDEKNRNEKLSNIRQKLDPNNHALLDVAYACAVDFIDLNARHEAGYGGSAGGAWIVHSQMEQKNTYLDLIEKVQSGYEPSLKGSFVEADRNLNETYEKVMANLNEKADNYSVPRVDAIEAVQQLWIPYRDATVKLFMAINPAVGEDAWKIWVTEDREKQLEKMLSIWSW